jgi:hypothetical protein
LACKYHLSQAPFSPKVDGFQGNGWKSSTLRFACFEKVDGFWGNSRKSSTLRFACFEKVDGFRGNSRKSSTLIFSALKKSMDFGEMDENHRLFLFWPDRVIDPTRFLCFSVVFSFPRRNIQQAGE